MKISRTDIAISTHTMPSPAESLLTMQSFYDYTVQCRFSIFYRKRFSGADHMNRLIRLIAAIFTLLILTASCAYAGDATIAPGKWSAPLSIDYTAPDGRVKTASVRIYFPKDCTPRACRRSIILLHDTSGTMRDWGVNTDIQGYADEYRVVLVCPDMGSTLYETKFYPETVKQWDGIPGGLWVKEVLVPWLQKTYKIAKDRKYTGIAGVAMGARGALLIASSCPDIFGAAAGLSGDYDKTLSTRKKTFATVYGDYTTNRDRWENDDNVIEAAEGLRDTPVFLGHGGRDRDTPVEQSRLLSIRIKQLQKKHLQKYVLEYHEKEKLTHDWKCWKALTQPMMQFFDTTMKK
jgi:hypothetical protein